MTAYVSVEALLIDWVKTALGYVNVVPEIPDNLMNLIRANPVVVIERFGGTNTTATIDVARVDVDVFANNRDAAALHSEIIRAAMCTRLVRHIYQGTVVGRVETLAAPTHRPYDSRTVVRRFQAAYQVTVHQFSGV